MRNIECTVDCVMVSLLSGSNCVMVLTAPHMAVDPGAGNPRLDSGRRVKRSRTPTVIHTNCEKKTAPKKW